MDRMQSARGQAGETAQARRHHRQAPSRTKSIQLEADRSRAEDMDMIKGISRVPEPADRLRRGAQDLRPDPAPVAVQLPGLSTRFWPRLHWHMSASVLDQLTLGYRLLWNRQRQPGRGRTLHRRRTRGHGRRCPPPDLHPDRTVAGPRTAPAAVRPQPSAAARPAGARPRRWPLDRHAAGRADRPRAAPARAAGPGTRPAPGLARRTRPAPETELAPSFRLGMYSLDEAQAVRALHALRARCSPRHRTPTARCRPARSCRRPSRVLADWALDHQAAWAVAGWPVDEMLRTACSSSRPAPTARPSAALLRAIDIDASLDQLETAVRRRAGAGLPLPAAHLTLAGAAAARRDRHPAARPAWSGA